MNVLFALQKVMRNGNMDETSRKVTKLNVNEFTQTVSNSTTLSQYLNICSNEFAISEKTTLIPSVVIDGDYDLGSEFEEFNDISEFIKLFKSMVDTYNCFIFSGESGIGKSMLMRKIVHNFARSYSNGITNYIPIYLDCKDYPGNKETLESWIDTILNSKYSNFEFFKSGQNNDYYVIFIDSINKLKSCGYDDFKEQVECWINWMVSLFSPTNVVIL